MIESLPQASYPTSLEEKPHPKIGVLYGFLLHEKIIADHDANSYPIIGTPTIPDDMIGTSSANLLWTITLTIVNEIGVELAMLTEHRELLDQAYHATYRLISMSDVAIRDRAFYALSGDALQGSTSNVEDTLEMRPPAYFPPEEYGVLEQVIRVTLGIQFKEASVRHESTQPVALAQRTTDGGAANVVMEQDQGKHSNHDES
jgi:hypothetical protein